MRRWLSAAVAVLFLPAAAQAQLFPIQQVPVVPAGPQNTMTVAGGAAASATNWPMQFGRPFLDGAIPHSPVVLANGVAIPSQADVKNRYPDGSVEFAVIAAQIPTISPTDCSIYAASPAEAPPYTLWPAHGNSPVFTIPANTTKDPVWQILETDHCHHFDGNVSRTFFGVEYPNHIGTSSVPAGGSGFTEEPTHYEANGIAQAADYPAPTARGLIYACSPWQGPGVPTTYSNPGIIMGCDIEGGGQNSGVVVIPPAKDIVFAATYNNVGSVGCSQVAGQSGPACGPYVNPVNSSTPAILQTAGNFAWGPDGDHVPGFEGGDTTFDSIYAQGVLPAATINAVNAAQAAYYATPGSPSPVECSNFGFTCDMALSMTHKLVATATTPYELYNVSAGTYRNADFDANGNSDTAADLAFCGTVSNCRLFAVYEQTSEGRAGPTTITFADSTATSTPLTLAQMEALLPVGAASMTLTPGGTADAGVMLRAGFCKPWTQGSVAQTMQCADDSAARTYDLGTGDGFHPFRPRFYVTFWPTTSQVFVRAVGENGLSTEQEDLKYTLAISDGYTVDLSGDQATNPKYHWANSRWSHTFWLGGTPTPQVNIDENLAYLASTRFLPNLDPTVTLAPVSIATDYTAFLSSPNDLYDGEWTGSSPLPWTNAMGTPGDSTHIGPYPEVTSLWLHSADWRLRQIALTRTDEAAAWPINVRESDPTRRFQRSDAGGSGTGLGHVYSAAGRPTIGAYSTSPDNLTTVGTVAPPSAVPWTADDAHQPSVYYPAYVLTGDPWYLDMLYAWAGWTVFEDSASPTYDCQKQTTNCSIFRGPTGAYGGLFGSNAARAVAWTLRGRVETAFAAPDGTPEKSYFRYMTNDAIAKWEGGLGITGTPFDTTAEKVWVKGTDFPYVWTANGGAAAGQVPPLGQMESICNPAANPPLCGYSTATQTAWGLVAGANGSFSDIWMNAYLEYALGRAAELGFPVQQIQAHYEQLPLGIIASAHPEMLCAYAFGDEKVGGGFWPDWPTVYANSESTSYLAGLQSGFAGCAGSNGYAELTGAGLAMALDQGVPGAASAWSWYNTNAYTLATSVSARNADPRWAIVPRTDSNVLPAQSTLTPP